ncbi:MAG: sigma-70 family RNA polymerase sigma factor [Phycisphaeraceae bacterium]|nr:sigma-70 family RNA polymerase sigma factor [Phycisphaeraceae bacterium]
MTSSDPSEHPGQRPGPEITRLLHAAAAGSVSERDELLRIVYEELQKIARSHMRGERMDHTLGATALVNESWLRLFRMSGTEPPPAFAHRHAFYKAAATAMRRILIDHARARAAGKRGSARRPGRIALDLLEASVSADPDDLVSLDDALCRLEQEDDRAATVVRLRFYGGRSIEEIAQMLSVSDRTIKRDWEFARARLQQILESGDLDGSADNG